MSMYNPYQRLGEIQREFVQKWPMIYDSEQLEAAAMRREVFGVQLSGVTLYPAFQLDEDGEPLPVIAELLKLADERSIADWSVALWFVAPHGKKPTSRKPVDMLKDKDRLLQVFLKAIEPEQAEDNNSNVTEGS
jgi:hypothetical protein